jgi:hypothetical protein
MKIRDLFRRRHPSVIPPAPKPAAMSTHLLTRYDEDQCLTIVASFEAPTDRMSDADLAAMLDRKRGVYRHVKTGNVYRITGFAIDTDTGVMRVSYLRIGGPGYTGIYDPFITYSRRAAEWTGDRFEFLHG